MRCRFCNNYLQEKGIIYNKRGIGYFLADDAYKATLQLRKEEKNININYDDIYKRAADKIKERYPAFSAKFIQELVKQLTEN